MPDETMLKDVSEKVNDLMSALERIADLSEEDRDKLGLLSRQPVGLRDTGRFNLSIGIIKRSDLQKARRELSSAISAEKWMEGFGASLQIMKILGGLG